MGVGALEKKGGKFDVNGLIEDYYVYAGENISAGSFVEFINGIAGQTTKTSTSTVISKSELYVGRYISAVELTDNNVFIAHGYDSDSYLYGIVVNIEGTTISCGTDTLLSGQSSAATQLATIRLSDDKVFVAHEYGSYYHYGMVCTISGTTITAGTDTKITNNGSSKSTIGGNLVLLENGNLFLTHGYGSDEYLYGAVIVINGTTVSIGADTKLNSSSDTGIISCSTLLSDNRVFILHPTSQSPYGMVVTIDGTTITKGTSTVLCDSAYCTNQDAISATTLSDGNVFVTYGLTASSRQLCGMVVGIEGMSITAGSHTQLSTVVETADSTNSLLLPDGNVVIIHAHTSSYNYLYGMVVDISGTTITAGTDTRLNANKGTGAWASAILLSNGSIFVAHSYGDTTTSGNYYLYGQVFGIMDNIVSNNVVLTEYETQVRNTTSSNANGIAKTSGVGGDSTGHGEQVSVCMPYFSLVANGDFESGINGWNGWHEVYVSFTQGNNGYSGKCAKFVVTTPIDSWTQARYPIEMVKGHIYYARVYIKGLSSNYSSMQPCIALYNNAYIATGNYVVSNITEWQKSSAYGTATTTGKGEIFLRMLMGNANGNITVGMAVYYDDVRVYDLTEMFGAGSEPDKTWCDSNL